MIPRAILAPFMPDLVETLSEQIRADATLTPPERAKILDFEVDLAEWQRRAGEGRRLPPSAIGLGYAAVRRLFAQPPGILYWRHPPAYRIPDDWRSLPTIPADSDIARQFAIFDDLSTYYGELYRGAAALSYLLSALAVVLALCPIFLPSPSTLQLQGFAATELAVMCAVAAIYARGRTPDTPPRDPSSQRLRHHRWHERWLEYRLLAERLRYLPLVLATDPPDQAPAPTEPTSAARWIDRYFAAVLERERSHKPPPDPWALRRIALLADAQYRYHVSNAETNHRIVRFVTFLATLLFAVAFVTVAWHVVMLTTEYFHEEAPPALPHLPDPVSMFAAAALPAIAAALHGIVASGEYHKLAEQSHEMQHRLERLIDPIVQAASPTEGGADADARLKAVVQQFRDLTLEETTGWHRALQDKNVPLP
jgi:hypothetical protein